MVRALNLLINLRAYTGPTMVAAVDAKTPMVGHASGDLPLRTQNGDYT